MKLPLLCLVGSLALGPISCTMAPKYTRPRPPVPATWPVTVGQTPTLDSTNALGPERWSWQECFTDEKLRHIISVALQNNKDLRLAALNVQRAQGIYGIQRAELLPTLDGVASGSRQRVPADFGNNGEARTFSQYSVHLGVAAWEIDFFGRIRSLKDRVLQEYLASEQGRRSAEVSLVAAVADAYLTLSADRESLGLAQTTLQAQRGSYDLVKRRYDLGLTPELDVFRAQTQVDSARGDVARFTKLVALDQNVLSLLLGQPIAEDALPAPLSGITPPRDVAPGMSSEVLLRRPDVLQAELLLKAAYADIGAARAAFFPRISLTAAFGTASADLSGLFKAGSGAWSYAPQLVMPIFDARTWSAYKVAKAQQEIAVTEYEKSIQTAFRDVADALAVRRTVDERVAAQESLVNAVAETYRLSNSRYERGIDSYLSVLDAQRSLYAAQQGLVSLRLAKLASQVRLFSALGGGWQT